MSASTLTIHQPSPVVDYGGDSISFVNVAFGLASNRPVCQNLYDADYSPMLEYDSPDLSADSVACSHLAMYYLIECHCRQGQAYGRRFRLVLSMNQRNGLIVRYNIFILFLLFSDGFIVSLRIRTCCGHAKAAEFCCACVHYFSMVF